MISELIVYGPYEWVKPFHMQLIVDEHPGLVELYSRDLKFTPDNAIWLMRFTSLKKYCFGVKNLSAYEQIAEKWARASIFLWTLP